MKDTIGFVGIGNMGAPMARRLLEAGHTLIVFDLNAEATRDLAASGARVADSIKDVGASATIVFVSVPTPDIVQAVASGLASGGVTRFIVDLSTTGPDMAVRVASDLAVHGIALVDCPVSGGVAGARAGSLALMVGAPEEDLATVRGLLETFGRVFHVGPKPGQGQMMKVINNLMSAAALVISGEGVGMAVKSGLDAETVIQVLNAGSGRNSATLDKFPRQILTGTFDAGFAIGLMLKDVKLCLAAAEVLSLDLPASRAVAMTWERAANEIGPLEDFTRVVQVIEKEAGVLMRKADIPAIVA